MLFGFLVLAAMNSRMDVGGIGEDKPLFNYVAEDFHHGYGLGFGEPFFL
jgi:hypothetical protein